METTTMPMSQVAVNDIVLEAKNAAVAAANAYLDKHGENAYCGFAWVEVSVTRTNSKQAMELLAAGFRKDYQPKTLSFWNPCGMPTQCMDLKEAGAVAFAAVLNQHGYKARACSRAD